MLGSADTAILLVHDLSVCGAAIPNRISHPVGIVKKSCAQSSYSFGHELGHIFGCQHNRETEQSGWHDYGYGHLMLPRGRSHNWGYRTMMS